MRPPAVCILTAGAGTRMGPYATLINKALLPLGSKAIISHIIDSFPAGTDFVVALGYQAAQVRAYLAAAHPHLSVRFVEVDNVDGPGSGPGYSLLACRSLLERPFTFVASDTLFTPRPGTIPTGNWAGVARVPPAESARYCNLRLVDGVVSDIRDKQAVDDRFRAFTGYLHVADHEVFWRHLADGRTVGGERQVSNGLSGLVAGGRLAGVEGHWRDLGDIDKYREAQSLEPGFDFSKTDEFIYFSGARVVKFFRDPQIVAGRTRKAALKPAVFPTIATSAAQFYSYDRVAGETLYADNSRRIFARLLHWLEAEVWTPVAVDPSRMQRLCTEFYKTKTLDRLGAFGRKYPDYVAPHTLNGEPVTPVAELIERLPWERLVDGVATFIHGDLQFDNILHDAESGRFMLLDWRQDFAGEVAYGDVYYDLAKLYGGLTLNYDYIKSGLFTVRRSGDDLTVDFAVHSLHEVLRSDFEDFVARRGFDLAKIRLLLGLIFLNMSPLHHAPFDVALYSLGARVLTQSLVEACPTL